MQPLKIFFTASGFLAYFAGMIVISAVTTSVVHSAMSPRAVPMAAVGH